MGCTVTTGSKEGRTTVIAKNSSPFPVVASERRVSASQAESTGEAEKASSATTLSSQLADSLTIVHFNDVYNIEEREKEPCGGAPRFKTQVDSLRELDPLVFFSGDALNPSNISIVMQGKQMVPVLNSMGINAAVYGNHDFDFGVDHLVELAGKMNFPWLMSNVRDKHTGGLLAEGERKIILEWKGKKVGIIGLVEWEWLVTLATLEPDDVIYTDFVEAARELVPELQNEGCDLIVALTHMRVPNDVRLAEAVPDIHLILGGHDHHYEERWVGDVLVLKSGSDFRYFSQITVIFPPDNDDRPSVEVVKHTITRDIPADPGVQAVVDQYLSKLEEGMKEVIGELDCELEGRFSELRTKETNLGNLVTDMMRRATRADVVLLNSGTMRSDTIHEAGEFKMKDLLSILPMVDSLVVIELTGEQLITALENGVSQYPKHEGRFPQISGMSFTFDPSQTSGSRIVRNSVCIAGNPLVLNNMYKLCTKGYIAAGKDGYDVFRDCKVLVNEEEGPILGAVFRNHFTMCQKLKRSSLAMGSRSMVDGFTTSTVRLIEEEGGHIAPKVEGRITMVANS